MVKGIFPSQGLVKVFEKEENAKLTLTKKFIKRPSHLPVYDIYIYISGKNIMDTYRNGHSESSCMLIYLFLHVDLFLSTGQKYATIP